MYPNILTSTYNKLKILQLLPSSLHLPHLILKQAVTVRHLSITQQTTATQLPVRT